VCLYIQFKKYVLLHNVFSLDEAHNLDLEAEEMVIQPPPLERSYRPNETTKQNQQPPIEDQSTKRDPSSTDMPATNNQMSDRGIQTDITFIEKPQAAVSKAKSLYDNNLVMKTISHIPSPKKRSHNSYPCTTEVCS